ncbi:hypothetical protein N0Y54_09905 [Nostoc punctiforme UO1]|uniref:hypothetical protein n=1 Tax=Nostoc punctiforme TaxID=272131 RepID=UPI0030B73E1D
MTFRVLKLKFRVLKRNGNNQRSLSGIKDTADFKFVSYKNNEQQRAIRLKESN